MDANELKKKWSLPLLSRGESLVASVGLAAALLLLWAVAAAGWWNLRTNQQARREGREQQVRAIAELLSQSAGNLLASDDVSALRTLIAGAGANYRLRTLRVAVGGPAGPVVADAAAQFKYSQPPQPWPKMADVPSEPVVERRSDGVLTVMVPIEVAGRGRSVLMLEDATDFPIMGAWQVQAGIGAIAATGLVLLLAAYRIVRNRFRGIGAVREALAAVQTGETDSQVLMVAPDLGPEAAAWNSVLQERDQMRLRLTHDKAAEALGNRRSRDGDLLSLCDAMWQGLILVDEHLKVKYINGAAAVFLRGKREDMLGAESAKVINDPKAMEALRAVASGNQRSRTVVEIERTGETGGSGPRGGSVLRFTIRPVRKEDSASAIVVIEDVTQQRVAEESRHAFVASATHELRTPLTNIRLYVDSLLEEPDQDVTKRTQAVNVISQESRRLERMVGDLLSVAQIEAGTVKLNRGDVRLEPVFDELRADFAEQAKQKDIGLKFDLPPKWPQVDGDRDKIMMALHNLVGNAIKYTPAGGEVTVRVGGDDKSVLVDVIDNGIGIKDDEQPMVFEKFYRAKDRRIANITGSGLGLSIAREVVRLHGGDITLQSQVDKGSTFSMTLPARAA